MHSTTTTTATDGDHRQTHETREAVPSPPAPTRASRSTLRAALRDHRVVALLIAVAGTVVSAAGGGTPALSWDEGSTVSAATRSWGELLQLVRSVDLVHLVWYGAVHCWFDVVGYSPATLRLLPALCVGVTAGLTTLLGWSLLGRRTGVLAGVLSAVLPRATAMGIEGRSYALSTLTTVLLTLVLVAAVRRSSRVGDAGGAGEGRARGRRWGAAVLWSVYATVATVAVLVFVYDLLVVVAHVFAVVAVAARCPDRARARRVLLGLGLAVGPVVVLVTPFVLAMASQARQVSWLQRPGPSTVKHVVVDQWFPEAPVAAALGLLLIAVGAVRLVRARPSVAVLLGAWLVVPVGVLIVVSLVWTPLYHPRYLSCCTPGVALVVAAAIGAWRTRWTAAVLVLAVLVSAPAYLRQRSPDGKGNDWDRVAAMSRMPAASAPGSTAALFGDVEGDASSTLDVISTAYPGSFPGAVDCRAGRSAIERGALWPSRAPTPRALRCARDHPVVWVVTERRDSTWRERVLRDLRDDGYRVEVVDDGGRTSVLRLERPSAAPTATG